MYCNFLYLQAARMFNEIWRTIIIICSHNVACNLWTTKNELAIRIFNLYWLMIISRWWLRWRLAFWCSFYRANSFEQFRTLFLRVKLSVRVPVPAQSNATEDIPIALFTTDIIFLKRIRSPVINPAAWHQTTLIFSNKVKRWK